MWPDGNIEPLITRPCAPRPGKTWSASQPVAGLRAVIITALTP